MSEAPPPPVIVEGFKTKKKKKVVNSIGEIDFTKVNKPFDISKSIEWDKIKNITLSDSDSGSNGVFFFQTHTDEIFIIKGSSMVAEEIFAGQVAPLFNVKAPKTDLIEYLPKPNRDKYLTTGVKMYGSDWAGCKDALWKISKLKPENVRLKSRTSSNLTRAFFLKMEFVYGKDIFKINAKEVFSSEKYLSDLGKIFVFDIFINNWDRIPCHLVWDHEGNEGNLLFTEEGIHGIDQSISPIKKGKDEKYMKCVGNFLDSHFSCKVEDNKFLETIGKFVYNNTTFKMGVEEKRKLWKGMDEGIKLVKNFDMKKIKEMKEKVKILQTGKDWENVYSDSVKRIDLQFLEKIYNIFTDKIEKYVK